MEQESMSTIELIEQVERLVAMNDVQFDKTFSDEESKEEKLGALAPELAKRCRELVELVREARGMVESQYCYVQEVAIARDAWLARAEIALTEPTP